MTQRTRRTILAAAGALGLSATAGCLSGDETEPDDESGESAGSDSTDDGADDSTNQSNPDDSGGFSDVDGTILGDITIDNLHDTDHSVDVRVEINSETKAWVDKDLKSRVGSVKLDRTWDSTGGEFRVQVRLDGDKFVEVTPEDWNDPDCLSLIVVIDQSGALRIAGDTTGGFCEA